MSSRPTIMVAMRLGRSKRWTVEFRDIKSQMRESMKTLNPALAKVLKRLHYPLDVILRCARWYVAYPAESASS